MRSLIPAQPGAPRGCSRSVTRRPAGRLGLAVAALAVLTVAAAGCASGAPEGAPGGQAAGPPRIADAGRLLVPARGALFGAWVQPGDGFSATDEEAAVSDFERVLGRPLAIDNIYANWAAPMPLGVAQWDLRHGSIPMISWGGAQTGLIADGAYDAQIRARAQQLRALHGPVLLRWFWEMDLTENAAQAGPPATFIAAWRRVHNIFEQAGATNVRWVWCPSGSDFATGQAQRFYPGSGYVDWVGADGYNWAPVRPVPWRSFGQIFAAFYRWGVSTGKPLLIGEFGALERAPGQKAAWFAEADRQLRTQFPAIRAIVYFDSYRENPSFGKYFNWKVTSSPSALAAFRAFVNDPYFSARPAI